MSEESLFDLLLAAAPADRDAILDRETADRPDVRDRLNALIAAWDRRAAADSTAGFPSPLGGEGLGVRGGPTSDTVHDQDSSEGTVIAGKYTLVERIGEGGMGAVWRAKQTEPVKRFVAVKLIKAGMDSKQVLARFEAERQALALMDHPNIAKVLDGGVTDFPSGGCEPPVSDGPRGAHTPRSGLPYFVMELVKGTPITEYCDAHKLPPKQRLELFVQACQAIQHAHQKGIIHRDIKPSNVLVALYDDRPVVKVIDFGVAKATGGTLTEATIDTGFGGLVGTPQYMSPEQATFNNLDIDTRSDVYALGVLLYELLAGSPPFSGDELKKKGLLEMLRVVREVEPPRPSTKLSTADALPSLSANRGTEPKKLTGLLRNELDWIVMKALDKDRTRRYETANGFAADVQRYLGGEAVIAHPPSAAYRFRKLVRRNKGRAAAALAVVAALAAGVVGTSLGLVEARRQRDVALVAQQAEAEAAERAREQQAEAEANGRRATDAEKMAREEAAAAKAVRDFLQKDLLGQASLVNQAEVARLTGQNFATKRNPTIGELIDRAATLLAPDKIEEKFPGMPFVQAETLRAVGEALVGIAQDANAVPLLTRAVALYTTARGPDDPATLAARHQLGLAFWFCDRQGESLDLLNEVCRDRERVLGPHHPDTFESKIYTTTYMAGANRLTDPVGDLKRIRDDARTHLGPMHYQTILATGQYIYALISKSRPDEAIREIEALQTAAWFAKVRPDHPFNLIGQMMLSEAYFQAGRQREAVPLLEKMITATTAQFGASDPTTLHFMGRLSRAYQQTGQPDRALPILRKTLAANRQSKGPTDTSIQEGVNSLSLALAGIGRYDEAATVAREQAAAVREKAGAGSAVYAKSLMILGRVLMWNPGVPEGAEPPLREAVAAYRSLGDTNSADYGGALSNLGLYLIRKGRHADAEPILRECLDLRVKLSPGFWIRYHAASMLGECLFRLGRHEEAESLLRAGYEGIRPQRLQLVPVDRIRFAEATRRWAEFLDVAGKADEAHRLRAEASGFLRELAPPPTEKK